ncbi:MAG: polyprenyl synthetase family protein [Candidatus Eisenbacteria bacterium]
MTTDPSILELQRPVRKQLDLVQDQLKGLFKTPIPILNEVGGHVLASRGKKFRPTMLLLTARLRGHLGKDAIICATVVELVHAAALIHDDSVDRSQLRRGMPTVNGLWTDEMAIIMGDYMYAQSMALLVEHGLTAAMGILARVVSEMSCGEAMEFQHAYDLDVKESDYEELIRSKTGSLIGAATEIGAGLNGGGRDKKRRLAYRVFGEKVGVAFQIVDDLFDYLSDSEVAGKPVGYDLAEGKVTLPLIAALRQASTTDRKKLHALASRKKWTKGQWAQLCALIGSSGGFDYARARARQLADEARSILASEPRNAARKALDVAVDYAIQRDH